MTTIEEPLVKNLPPLKSISPLEAASTVPEHLLEATPFAALEIGGTRFEIANGETDDELMYRIAVDSPWVPLQRNLENGWHYVGAEILISTRDAIYDYIMMHMINTTPEESKNEYVRYTLFGYDWKVMDVPHTNRYKVQIDDGEWIQVVLDSEDTERGHRILAINALLDAAPSVASTFSRDVEAWAVRLAAGANVSPIF